MDVVKKHKKRLKSLIPTTVSISILYYSSSLLYFIWFEPFSGFVVHEYSSTIIIFYSFVIVIHSVTMVIAIAFVLS